MTSPVTIEADVQRAVLTEELAEWIETTFLAPSRATRLYRSVRVLAKAEGRTFGEVLAELERGARRLLDEQLVR